MATTRHDNNDNIVVNQAGEMRLAGQTIYIGKQNPGGPFSTLPSDTMWDSMIARPDLMKKIESGFQSNPHQIITGASGVGKSQISMKFARNLKESRDNFSVFRVPMDSPESFCKGYRFIAAVVGLTAEGSDPTELLLKVQAWLDSNASKSWLLLVDNANMDTLDPYSPAQFSPGQLLPTAHLQRGHLILTTTQDRNFKANDAHIIELSTLSMDEARELLAPVRTRGIADSQIADLVIALDYNLRAIHQASNYLSHPSIHLDDLRKRLEKIMTWNRQATAREQPRYNHDEIKALLPRDDLSLRKILDNLWETYPAVIHSLGVLSCFQQSCTSHAILERCGRFYPGLSNWHGNVATLKRYYLVSDCQIHQEATGAAITPQCYKVPELVRMDFNSWSRNRKLPDSSFIGEFLQDLWHHEALCALFKFYETSRQLNRVCDENIMVSQGAAFSRYIKQWKPKIAIDTDLAKTFIQAAAVNSKAGQYEQSQTLLEHLVNNDPPKYWHAYALVDLAETIRSQRRNQNESALKAASEHLHEADRIAHELGKVNLRIKVGSALSLVCCDHQNFPEAIVYQELTLDLLKGQYNEHHIKYLEAQLVYGKVLHHDLQFDKAIEEVQGVLERSKKASENDYERKSLVHSAELTLARIYFSKEEHETACNFAEKGYNGRCALLGGQAFKTISAGVYYVCCLYRQRRGEEAKKLSVSLMDTARACHGQNNEQVLEWQEAMAMFR